MPGSTRVSSSFQIQVIDPSSKIIEQITQGITVKATPGNIGLASVQASKYNINS